MARLGSVKLQTEKGAVELPVYDTADVGKKVHDMVRVRTESGVGFIPFTDPSNAAYQHLKLNTENKGVLAAHNRPAISGVIDSFERGNLIGPYSGKTQYYSEQTSFVVNGDKGLRFSNPNNDGVGNATLTSSSGLNYYPRPGDTIEWQIHLTDNTTNYWSNNQFSFYACFDNNTNSFLHFKHQWDTNDYNTDNASSISLRAMKDGSTESSDSFNVAEGSTGDTFRYVWNTSKSGMNVEIYKNGSKWNTVSCGSHSVDFTQKVRIQFSLGSDNNPTFDLDYIHVN